MKISLSRLPFTLTPLSSSRHLIEEDFIIGVVVAPGEKGIVGLESIHGLREALVVARVGVKRGEAGDRRVLDHCLNHRVPSLS